MSSAAEQQPLIGVDPDAEKLATDMRSDDTATKLTPFAAFVEGQSYWGWWVNAAWFALVVLNVGIYLASTDEATAALIGQYFEPFETFCIALFMVEYLLRLAASGTAFLFSASSILALLAIVPYWVVVVAHVKVFSIDVVRVLRMFRLFEGEGKYFEGFTLCDDVWREQRDLIIPAAFTGLVVWITMAVILFAVERSNEEAYNSIGSSLWWSLLNLTGEFPINDSLTFWGQVTGGITVVLAVGVFAIPTGILGSGLVEIFKRRKAEAEEDGDTSDSLEDEICSQCQLEVTNQAGLQGWVWATLNAKNAVGWWVEVGLLLLIVLNIVAFSIQTIEGTGHESLFMWLEVFSVAIFTAEYLLRVYASPADPEMNGKSHPHLRYMLSFFGLVDLATILPFYIDIVIPQEIAPTTFIRSLRLLQVLRADAFLGTFQLFDDVLRAQKDIMVSCGFVAFISWVFFTVVLHHTEHSNPDEEVSVEFTSALSSAWIALLNLTGEYPLGNYTSLGRCFSAVSALFAISVFAIPTGIFANGFEELIEEQQERLQKRSEQKLTCGRCGNDIQLVKQPEDLSEVAELLKGAQEARLKQIEQIGDTFQGWTYKFLAGVTPAGQTFQSFIIGCIAINILAFIISTDEKFMEAHPSLSMTFEVMEWITMLLFTAEYIGRLWSAPCNPKYTCDGPRLHFICSFFGLIDLCAILPFWIDVASTSIDLFPTTMFRIFRLLTVFKSRSYVEAFNVFINVFAAKRLILACTGYIAAICVLFFATLLHYTEKDNPAMVGHLTIGQRYRDVPHALFFTTLHLSGDYPLYQYTTWGKLVNFLIVIVGVGLVGIPSGIIVAGFQQVMLDMRGGEDRTDELRVILGEDDVRCQACRISHAAQKGLRARVHSFLIADTLAGTIFQVLVIGMAGLSVGAFVISNTPAVVEKIGDADSWLLVGIEYAAVALFTVEYILRIYAAPEDSDYGGRWDYATSFLSTVDLVSIAPFYISFLLEHDSSLRFIGSALCVVRLLKAEHYFEAITIFDNVAYRCKHVLFACSFFALLIWVVCATLFYITESDNEELDGAFASIPKALYFTILFLGGEWVLIDFTAAGKLVGIVVVVLGIGTFAVPAAILFAAFQDMLVQGKAQLEKCLLGAPCKDCGMPIDKFRHHRTADETAVLPPSPLSA